MIWFAWWFVVSTQHYFIVVVVARVREETSLCASTCSWDYSSRLQQREIKRRCFWFVMSQDNSGNRPRRNKKAQRGGPAEPDEAPKWLMPADRVYHRVMWDEAIAREEMEVGYEDRFVGVLFMPVLKFRHTGDETTEIPFHRVRFFRYRGQIVWDREAKIDLMSELCSPEAEASEAPPPALAATIPGATPLDILPCEKDTNKCTHEAPPAVASCQADVGGERDPPLPVISVCSFNILFDLYDAELLHTPERIVLLCAELERVDADIIGLQEVTPPLLDAIRRQSAKLRRTYYWSTTDASTKSSQVVLSRWPLLEAVSLSMSRHKRCIFASVQSPFSPNERIVIANVHLVSDYAGDSMGPRRVQELQRIFHVLRPYRSAICLGDFNFGDEGEEQTAAKWEDFVDCHLAVKGKLPQEDDVAVAGCTYDIERNWIADLQAKHHRYSRRLDRILVRGFSPRGLVLIGTKSQSVTIPPAAQPIELFPSDHFGLLASLELLPNVAEAPGAPCTQDAAATAPVPVPVRASCDPSGQNFFPFFSSALCVVLPSGLYARIDAIRRDNDKAYPRWMPHINLLFPFIHPSKFSQAIELIAPIVSRFRPFSVKLRKVNHFPAKKPVVFLVPESENDTLERLHAELQPIFPQCQQGHSKHHEEEGAEGGERGFQPHCTLGQAEHAKLQEFLDKIRAGWEPTEFTVTQICIIAHLPDTPGFEVMHAFPLQGEPPVASPPAASSAPLPPQPRTLITTLPQSFNAASLLMEDPQWGSKRIEPYVPADPLEMWMATVTVSKYARDAPTHISQLGAMYHVPSDLLDQYLVQWEASCNHCVEIPFFMEEIRGNPFRLYVDLDVKRTIAEPYDATELVILICRTVAELIPGCDSTALVTHCHGPWQDTKAPDACFKSGYRIFFQRVFVDQETYARVLTKLCQRMRRDAPPIPALPQGDNCWEAICDVKSVQWDRGRLFGTIKRRKRLERIYRYTGIYNASGKDERLSDAYSKCLQAVLYGTTLRLWDVAPSAAAENPVAFDSGFTLERFYKKTPD